MALSFDNKRSHNSSMEIECENNARGAGAQIVSSYPVVGEHISDSTLTTEQGNVDILANERENVQGNSDTISQALPEKLDSFSSFPEQGQKVSLPSELTKVVLQSQIIDDRCNPDLDKMPNRCIHGEMSMGESLVPETLEMESFPVESVNNLVTDSPIWVTRDCREDSDSENVQNVLDKSGDTFTMLTSDNSVTDDHPMPMCTTELIKCHPGEIILNKKQISDCSKFSIPRQDKEYFDTAHVDVRNLEGGKHIASLEETDSGTDLSCEVHNGNNVGSVSCHDLPTTSVMVPTQQLPSVDKSENEDTIKNLQASELDLQHGHVHGGKQYSFSNFPGLETYNVDRGITDTFKTVTENNMSEHVPVDSVQNFENMFVKSVEIPSPEKKETITGGVFVSNQTSNIGPETFTVIQSSNLVSPCEVEIPEKTVEKERDPFGNEVVSCLYSKEYGAQDGNICKLNYHSEDTDVLEVSECLQITKMPEINHTFQLKSVGGGSRMESVQVNQEGSEETPLQEMTTPNLCDNVVRACRQNSDNHEDKTTCIYFHEVTAERTLKSTGECLAGDISEKTAKTSFDTTSAQSTSAEGEMPCDAIKDPVNILHNGHGPVVEHLNDKLSFNKVDSLPNGEQKRHNRNLCQVIENSILLDESGTDTSNGLDGTCTDETEDDVVTEMFASDTREEHDIQDPVYECNHGNQEHDVRDENGIDSEIWDELTDGLFSERLPQASGVIGVTDHAQTEDSPVTTATDAEKSTAITRPDPKPSTQRSGQPSLSRRKRKQQRRKLDARRRYKCAQPEPCSTSSSSRLDLTEETDVHKSLTCPICLDIYLNAYSCHPCGHVFCEPCLRRLAKYCSDNQTDCLCPICRDEIRACIKDWGMTNSVKTYLPDEYEKRLRFEGNNKYMSHPLPSKSSIPSLHHISQMIRQRRAAARQRPGYDATGISFWRYLLFIVVLVAFKGFLFLIVLGLYTLLYSNNLWEFVKGKFSRYVGNYQAMSLEDRVMVANIGVFFSIWLFLFYYLLKLFDRARH